MQATITGHDPLSKRILLDLDLGMKVSQIPEHYPVSLDQAKRLSRFKRMLNMAQEYLEEEYYDRLYLLGLKSLPLSHLCKKRDWSGLIEILSLVTDETTRDELQLLIQGLNDKRERIAELKEGIEITFSELENEEQLLLNKEKELLQLKKELNSWIKGFNRYREPFRSFLGEHLGLYQGELILVKRLNIDWQQELRIHGIIDYDPSLDVYFIKEFDDFIESLKSRYERGLEYRWDPIKDLQRSNEKNVPHDGTYTFPSALGGSLVSSRDKVIQVVNELKRKKKDIQEEIKRKKQEAIQAYMRMVESPDYISMEDLKKRKELQEKASMWLFQRGFVVVTDFSLPNEKKTDIFAYSESQIIIFEIKVSDRDLITDQKWTNCLSYCHDFYFLTPADLKSITTAKLGETGGGQFVETDDGIQLVYPDTRNMKNIHQEEKLKFLAAQLLSRKIIHGY